jgi:hypothetical protein
MLSTNGAEGEIRRAEVATRFLDEIMTAARRGDLTYNEIRKLTSALRSWAAYYDEDYVNCVLFPELYNPVRMPTAWLVPTVPFTVRSERIVDPSTTGEFGIVVFPQMFGSISPYLITYVPVAAGQRQVVPSILAAWPTANVDAFNDTSDILYKSARLVAASLTIEYIGRADAAQGFLRGGLEYSDYIGALGNNILIGGSIDDAYYLQTSHSITDGLRVLWVPKDVEAEQFHAPTGGFGDMIVAYGRNLQGAGAGNYRVTVIRHFEGMPMPEYRDLIPVEKTKTSDGAIAMIKNIHTKASRLLNLKPEEVRPVAAAFQGRLHVFDDLMTSLGGIASELNPGGNSFFAGVEFPGWFESHLRR